MFHLLDLSQFLFYKKNTVQWKCWKQWENAEILPQNCRQSWMFLLVFSENLKTFKEIWKALTDPFILNFHFDNIRNVLNILCNSRATKWTLKSVDGNVPLLNLSLHFSVFTVGIVSTKIVSHRRREDVSYCNFFKVSISSEKYCLDTLISSTK